MQNYGLEHKVRETISIIYVMHFMLSIAEQIAKVNNVLCINEYVLLYY